VAVAMGTGIRRVVDAMGASYRWWILAAAASILDSTLATGSGTMDAATALGTSSRRAIDAVGNVADVVRTSSSRRVRYDISVSMNQLVLSFARTRNFKMLTLTMGLHRSLQY
jgi:hypothetical protein